MKNFTHFTHESVPEFITEITKLWQIYGKTTYKLFPNKYTHDVVNIKSSIVYNTKLGQWITSTLGDIENCKFFVCDAESWGETHVDGKGVPRNCAINIPIEHCNSGVMNWFSNTDELDYKVTSRTTVYTSSRHNDIDYWNSVESMTLTQPALVRTNCWHNIDNRLNPNPRVVFSIRLKDNPPFEDILDKIKPWAV